MFESSYKSQYQQDRILNESIFLNKKNGIFVDIGAHDGKTLSNTYFYEKELEWTGLCIEPLPRVFSQLKENRSCILINGCAWSSDTFKTFRIIEGYSEMLSGILDAYPQSHVDRINSESQSNSQIIKDVDVKCYDINKLLKDNKLFYIDLLSIDVEGSELEILKAIDYIEIKIDVILAENNYNDSNLRDFLISKGYAYIGSISIDDVFVLRSAYEVK